MDKKEKELEDSQGRRIIASVGIIVLALVMVVVVASALSPAPADEPEKQARLYVDEVFFVISGSDFHSENVKIDITTFITNKGTLDAKDVEIKAFAIDVDSNLAMDKATLAVGQIPIEKTVSSEFSLTVPNYDSYNIRLIILESGKIAIKGSGSVHLDREFGGRGTRFSTDNGYGDGDGDGDGADGGDGDGDGYAILGEKGEYSSGGLLLLLLFSAVCVIIFALVIIFKKSPAPQNPYGTYPPPNYLVTSEEKDSNLPLFMAPNIQEAIVVESEEQDSPLDKAHLSG